jgi:transcriptional regulator with XRE-family HTH domain
MNSSVTGNTPDFERMASELLRALRGERSQEAFARRLGCRSHAIYTWESGRNYPTAARAFFAAQRGGVDVSAALERFYRRPPAWLSAADFSSPASVARLLDDLRGKTPVAAIARATGRTRFAVARWLKGQAQPRLPDFLRLIEASSLRLLDFVACLVDPEQMPSIAPAYRDLESTRRAAYEMPWSHAFLRALELQAYKALPAHRPGWLADTLALDRSEEERSLALLEQSGQITLRDGRFVPTRVTTVDTRRDAQAARRLHQFFSLAAAQRLQQAPEGTTASAYNLFGVSRVDLERLRELQRAYFREMRAIIADSEPVEAVVLANMQMVELSTGRSTDA